MNEETNAADLAQRVADLEAERDKAHQDAISAAVERDELRARLAEIEGQEPVAISKEGNLFWAGNPQDNRGVNCSLYARPVPAIPDGWRLVQVEPTPDVDALAQYIRSIDGRNLLGAGALAERIVEWMAAPEAAR